MHSRIYQLSKEPVFECDYIGESDFWESLPYGADYVNENTNQKQDIEWLVGTYSKFNLTFGEEILENSSGEKETCYYLTFPENFKYNYFSERFKELRTLINDFTLTDFCHSIKTYQIKSLIEDRYGFRVYDGWEISFDYFVRELPDQEIKYYIGKTIDYHF
jgi:hypothetical protein